jgi:tetratricopeptide (TPR) repeat protein
VTITSVNNLGGLLFEQRKFADAEALFRKVLDARRRVQSDAHPDTLGTLSNLGRAIRAQSRDADAEPVFAELYRLTPTADVPARQAALFTSHWGPCLVQLGRYDAADAPLRDAMERLSATDQTTGEHMQRVLSALAEVCQRTGRPDEAAALRERLGALAPTTRAGTDRPTVPATRRADLPATSPR